MDENRVTETGDPKGAPSSDRFKAETAHHHPSDSGTTDEAETRAYAYALWMAEGRPDGRDAQHWSEAKRHLRSRKAGTPGCRQ
jgi:hypothetical protein